MPNTVVSYHNDVTQRSCDSPAEKIVITMWNEERVGWMLKPRRDFHFLLASMFLWRLEQTRPILCHLIAIERCFFFSKKGRSRSFVTLEISLSDFEFWVLRILKHSFDIRERFVADLIIPISKACLSPEKCVCLFPSLFSKENSLTRV